MNRGKPRIAATTLREFVLLDPGKRCPDCGGALRLLQIHKENAD